MPETYPCTYNCYLGINDDLHYLEINDEWFMVYYDVKKHQLAFTGIEPCTAEPVSEQAFAYRLSRYYHIYESDQCPSMLLKWVIEQLANFRSLITSKPKDLIAA